MTTELKKNDDGIACYSASLSPPQICDIMSRAIASKADFMGPGDFPTHKTYRVGIVIRNLRTGEETLLTQPTFPPLTPTFSTDWILPYVDHPVFRHFDFASMKTPPYLESPHLRPQDLCTTCTFEAGREEELQAIRSAVDRILSLSLARTHPDAGPTIALQAGRHRLTDRHTPR